METIHPDGRLGVVELDDATKTGSGRTVRLDDFKAAYVIDP